MGVHLTLTSEWAHYRQAPVLGAAATPTLVDEHGLLPRTVEGVVTNANVEEMVLEMAAQVERAADFGITPTHLDCHMGVAFASPEFLRAYLEVANQFALPAFLPAGLKTVFPEAVVNVADDADWVDHFAMATPELAADAWPDFYTGVIDRLGPGLTLVVVHLAFDDPEMAAITKDHPDYGAAWRQRDLDVVTSDLFINHLINADVDVARWSGL
jgi:predicted glycoside hydrolase/deacetylase ChbG (UPF0249 family)